MTPINLFKKGVSFGVSLYILIKDKVNKGES